MLDDDFLSPNTPTGQPHRAPCRAGPAHDVWRPRIGRWVVGSFGALALAACVSDSSETTRQPLGPGEEDPSIAEESNSPYSDNFVQRSRYRSSVAPGPSFVEITDVEVNGDFVYLCTATQGLMVVDRTDPDQLLIIEQIASSHDGRFPRCQHVRVNDDIVSITNRGDEISATPHLTLFDASDPSSLRQVATIGNGALSFEGHLLLAPNLYAVAVHTQGLVVLERDGAAFNEIARLDGFNNAWDMVQSGDVLIVADGSHGVTTVDISDPRSPQLAGTLELPGATKHLELGENGVAFAASGADGVHILDVSEPTEPELLTTFDTPGSALMTGYADGKLHIADWNDVRVLDVTDPESPWLVATEQIMVYEFPRVLAIDAAGANSYVGEWTGLFDLELVDSGPAPDIRVGSLELQFPKTEAEGEAALALIIGNEGDAPLEVTSIETASEDSVFSTQAESLTIAPGEEDFVEIRFRPTDDSSVVDELTLRTDDPDEGAVRLALLGNQRGTGPGDPLPDFSWTDIETGETISTASLRGSVAVLSYFATF